MQAECDAWRQAYGLKEPNVLDALDTDEAATFRSCTGRALYYDQDRVETHYAVKECARGMSKLTVGGWMRLKKLGRYYAGHPRQVWRYKYQKLPKKHTSKGDSDWAGDKESRKSTSSGMELFGAHLLDSWGFQQQVVALSSGEAELYAMCAAAARGIETLSLLADCGTTATVDVGSDSTAARGIASRIGVGKLKHVQIRFLWIQQEVRERRITIYKENTDTNTADLNTKHLSGDRITRLLGMLPVLMFYNMKSLKGQSRAASGALMTLLVALLPEINEAKTTGNALKLRGASTMPLVLTVEEDGYTYRYLEVQTLLYGVLALLLGLAVLKRPSLDKIVGFLSRRRAPSQEVQTEEVHRKQYGSMTVPMLQTEAMEREVVVTRGALKQDYIDALDAADHDIRTLARTPLPPSPGLLARVMALAAQKNLHVSRLVRLNGALAETWLKENE